MFLNFNHKTMIYTRKKYENPIKTKANQIFSYFTINEIYHISLRKWHTYVSCSFVEKFRRIT